MRAAIHPRHNPGMSRKTQLAIAAAVELFLGAYCGLAFVAWCAKTFLFNAEKISFSPMVLLWFVLMGVFVAMYIATWRRRKALEAEEEQIKALERFALAQPATAPDTSAAQGAAKESVRG